MVTSCSQILTSHCARMQSQPLNLHPFPLILLLHLPYPILDHTLTRPSLASSTGSSDPRKSKPWAPTGYLSPSRWPRGLALSLVPTSMWPRKLPLVVPMGTRLTGGRWEFLSTSSFMDARRLQLHQMSSRCVTLWRSPWVSQPIAHTHRLSSTREIWYQGCWIKIRVVESGRSGDLPTWKPTHFLKASISHW